MRKNWTAVIALVAAAVLPSVAQAQDSSQVKVEAAVGTSVADKALVGAADSFPAGTASVVVLIKITGAADSDVEAAWYKGEAEMARVKLAIKGSPFRTWSSKKLPADAAGDWRCDIVQGGKVLQSVKFKVQ